MNKSDLIENVVQATGVAKKETEKVVDALFSTLKTAVKKGERVAWPNFGAFSLSERKARTGRNPQTGEPVKIKASKAMRFSPGKPLKDFLNSPGGARKSAAGKAGAAKAPGQKGPASSKKAPAKKAASTRKR